MDTMRVVAAWIMFLLMAITAAVFWRQSALRSERVEVLEATISGLEDRIRYLAEEMQSLHERLETVAATEEVDRDPAAASSSVSGDVNKKEEIPEPPFFEKVLTALGDGAGEDGLPADFFQSLMEVLQGESGQEFLSETFRGAMEMHYGAFLDSLPPETAEAFMDVLMEHSTQMLQQGMKLFGGSGKDGDIGDWMNNSMETMTEELRAILGEDGYAAFEEYSAQAAVNAYREQVDMQLRMFAGNMDPATRELISATLAEEMMSDSSYHHFASPMDQSIDEQDAALDRAMERLYPQLDDDAYRALERFANHQRRMYDMMRSFMPGLSKE